MFRTVIVNLKDSEEAIRGVLWSSRGKWLTLKRAELLIANQPPVPLDGEQVVHRDNVAFMQVMP